MSGAGTGRPGRRQRGLRPRRDRRPRRRAPRDARSAAPSDAYFTRHARTAFPWPSCRGTAGATASRRPRSTTGPTSAASRCWAATRCSRRRPAAACGRSSPRARRSSRTSSSTGRGTARDTFFSDGVVAHAGLADPVCPALSVALEEAAPRGGLAVRRGGTYVCMEGPQFSTRAESRLYRSWGADIIGMTNLTEARLAREAEICYASLALVTDYDCWREATEDVSVEAILAVLEENAAAARRSLAGGGRARGSGPRAAAAATRCGSGSSPTARRSRRRRRSD